MSDTDDDAAVVDEIMSALVRERGIAIGRDDPVLDVVLGCRRVLRLTLADLVPPVTASIKAAADRAKADMEATAEAQAHWLEQTVLKDRAKFSSELSELHESWAAEVQSIVQGHETALRRVVVQTVQLIQDQHAAKGPPPRRPPGLGWGAVALVGLVAAVVGAGSAVLAMVLGSGVL
jgi:hypothetical protein